MFIFVHYSHFFLCYVSRVLIGIVLQSRLYLGLGRDGLLPPIFAKVHPTHHTPIHSQVWVGIVAIILAGLFDVQVLSHILSVGSLVCQLLTL